MAGHLIPKLNWALTVSYAEATDEVDSEHLDGSLGSIHTVFLWLHKLPYASFLLEILFDGVVAWLSITLKVSLRPFFLYSMNS